MPSGSHGGGGGSHGGSFGGGGSHSSGGWSRGSSSGPRMIVSVHHHHGLRMRPDRYGRERYFNLDYLNGLIWGIICFFIFIAGTISCSYVSNIDDVVEDYRYYQTMIENAEEDPDKLIVEGTVTGKMYKTEYDKYYITYTIPLRSKSSFNDGYFYSSGTLDGYSFSIYDSEQIKAFRIGDKISIAIDSRDGSINYKTDSVPMDYKDVPLERDGEYCTLMDKKDSALGVIIILCGVLVAWVVVFCVLTAKARKQFKEAENSPVSSTSVGTSNRASDSRCPYCGAILANDGSGKCPNCGASRK